MYQHQAQEELEIPPVREDGREGEREGGRKGEREIMTQLCVYCCVHSGMLYITTMQHRMPLQATKLP